MRSTLPSRIVGCPSISPVIQPDASRVSCTASSSSTPSACAIGRVMNSLVAVTITIWSPASRCAWISARAAGWIAGVMTSVMNCACARFAASAPRARTASVAKRT
ncbi:hypothetical protein D3C85_1455540 [compost metagenome]